MILVILLIALGISLEILFFFTLWPPWKSSYPPMAWLLISLAGVLAGYDVLILLATLQIPVNPILALLILLGKDVVLAWRVKAALQARIHSNIARKRGNKVINPTNPFAILTLIPPRYRVWVYAVGALLLFGYGVWKAANGDWEQFFASMGGSLISALAGSNVNPEPPKEDSPAVTGGDGYE